VSVGSEDTSSPYSITWDGTATSSGSKFIVAVARDAAGNYATSTAITVTLDNTAPVISPISSGALTTTSATVTWTTGENSDSQVNYGSTSAYGASTTLDSALVTSHSVALSGLTANTVYHFRVRSAPQTGKAT
jgi:beta-mannanase